MREWAQAEIERILANIVRVGVISELDENNALVKVRTAGLTTDWLPWLTHRAGEDRTWWAPEPGEQVVILSPYGDMGQAVVLPSIYQDAHGAPANKKTITRTEWKDGGFIQYDREAHSYQLDVPAEGEIKLRIGGTTLVMKDGETILTTPKLTVDSPESTFTGKVTVQGLLAYMAGMTGRAGNGAAASIQGAVAVSGGDVTADGIALKDHRHTGVKGGPDMTGSPV